LILSASREKRRRPRPKHRILRLCSSCRSRPRWTLPWSTARFTGRQPGRTKQESALIPKQAANLLEGLAQWSNNERRLTTLEKAQHSGPTMGSGSIQT